MRPMVPADINECVRIHLVCFPQSFLSSLGSRFLTTYYEGVARSEQAISIVCESNDQVIGFVVGLTDPRRCYRYLLRTRSLRFFLTSLAAVARNPIIAPRLLRALTYPSSTPSGSERVLLSSLAVLPLFRRQGVGTSLVKEFAMEAAARGGKEVYLGVKRDDWKSIRFYRNLEFRETCDIANPGNGDSILMSRDLLVLEADESHQIQAFRPSGTHRHHGDKFGEALD